MGETFIFSDSSLRQLMDQNFFYPKTFCTFVLRESVFNLMILKSEIKNSKFYLFSFCRPANYHQESFRKHPRAGAVDLPETNHVVKI